MLQIATFVFPNYSPLIYILGIVGRRGTNQWAPRDEAFWHRNTGGKVRKTAYPVYFLAFRPGEE